MLRRAGLLGMALAVACASFYVSTWSAPPAPKQGDGPEVSPAAAALLKVINGGSEPVLKKTAGLTPEVVARIMTHRASGKRFSNLLEFQSITRIAHQDLEVALQPFQDAEDQKAFEAQRKPVPDPPGSGKAAGRIQRQDAAGAPAAAEGSAAGSKTEGTEGPIALVRPGFYAKLPGFDDLDKVDPVKRTEFLETVNREMCTCGCKNETIAFCLVNDPGCPVVKARAKKIYDDIVNKPH